jgi:hypothetical protein
MATSPHFQTDRMLPCPCCGVNGVKQAVLDAAEAIRAKAEARYGMGRVRMGVQSGYRCEDHNKAIGGAQNSQHMQGTALDLNLQIAKDSGGKGKLAWVTVAPREWEDLARQGPGIGGYGRDDERNFAHIDTREKMGAHISQWCYKNGKEVPYYPAVQTT